MCIRDRLDVFSFTLLVPFLDKLFKQQTLPSPISGIQQRIVGAFIDDANPQAALVNIIIVILVAVTLKNLFVWASGQLGAQLQEYVTRDLRNALYAHLQLSLIHISEPTRLLSISYAV